MENTGGPLQKYIPKYADLSGHAGAHLAEFGALHTAAKVAA
jgi:hypothetical protein